MSESPRKETKVSTNSALKLKFKMSSFQNIFRLCKFCTKTKFPVLRKTVVCQTQNFKIMKIARIGAPKIKLVSFVLGYQVAVLILRIFTLALLLI